MDEDSQAPNMIHPAHQPSSGGQGQRVERDEFDLYRTACVCLTVVAWFALPAVRCSAQDSQDAPDKVIINPGGRASTRVTLKGEILEYTGESLRIRLKPGETAKEYPASDVVEILTPQISEHQRGLDLFQKGDYPGAEKTFRKAFDDEARPWVKREILTYLIRCALMQGDYVNATAKFAILLRSDPRTHSFPLIPLVWTQLPPNPALKSQGEDWLLDDKQPPAIRLMGASILLEDPQLGATATLALRNLAAQSDRRVGVLAACQQWRLRLATRKEINLTELKAWQQKLDSLPEELRGGPQFLMGRAYVSRREFELGAVHLLWAPLVQPEDHFFAARATLEAADALVTIGQLEAGASLYEEIAARFGDTPSAQEAASQLKELLKQENGAERQGANAE